MQKPYRVLLPSNLPKDQRPGDYPPEDSSSKRRRTAVRVACNPCRSRKSACDGQRPTCDQCRKRGTPCTFRTVNVDVTPNTDLRIQLEAAQKQLAKREDQLNRLTFMPESNTAAHLKHLRTQSDLASLLFSFESGIGSHTSGFQVPRHILPTGTSRLELELMTDYPSLYPLLIPIDITAIDLESTGTLADRSGSRTSQKQPSFSNFSPLGASLPSSPFSTSVPAMPPSLEAETSYGSDNADGVDGNWIGSQSGGELCDKKLLRLRISHWTNVVVTDALAASAISLYLELEHPLLGFFDAELFLTDLVEWRKVYCSNFMVSALLYHACQLYTATEAKALLLAKEFHAEALGLWESGDLPEDMNTLAGINLLGLGEFSHGRDDRIAELFQASRQLCEKLMICNVPHTQENMDYHIAKSAEWKRAAAHAGWGSHNWLLQQAAFCRGKGIDHPPMLPIPGDSVGHAALGGEWAAQVPAKYVGQTFIATSKMWMVAREVLCVYSNTSYRPLSEKVSRNFAEEKYREMLNLLHGLPLDVARNSEAPTSVIMFHLMVHCQILDIFRPTLMDPSRQGLHSFHTEGATTRHVFGASVNQLKRLLIICRLRHPRSLYTTYLNSPILHVCNAMLSDVEDSERQFYFRLCLYCVRDLYVCLPVDLSVAQSVLVMAMRRGFITGADALGFMTSLRAGQDHREAVDGVAGMYTVDYNLALTAPREAEARVLAQAFDDLTLFSGVTDERYFDEGQEEEESSGSRAISYGHYLN